MKKSLFPQEKVHCAHEDCSFSAMANIKVKTGRANLCRFHYDQHFQIQADTENAKNGITTVEQMRERCKQIIAQPKRPAGRFWAHEIMSKIASGDLVSMAAYELAKTALKPPIEREPGSDDEVAA